MGRSCRFFHIDHWEFRGALTGNAFTFTGGTTGLTFAGTAAPNTQTLTGTLGIANGGTDATSFTQTNGIVAYNGTRLVNYAGPQLSSGGIMTNTSQPCFLSLLTTIATAVTGGGGIYSFGTAGGGAMTTIIDNTNSVSTVGGVTTFTCPQTGIYQINAQFQLGSVTALMISGQVNINLSTGAVIQGDIYNPGIMRIAVNITTMDINFLIYLGLAQTISASITVLGGTGNTATVNGTLGNYQSWFEGVLIC